MDVTWTLGTTGLVSTLIWIVANVAYLLFRSNDEGGFKRIVAFWMGMPLTWLTLVVVREGVPMVSEEAELSFDAEMQRLRAEIADDRADRDPLSLPDALIEGPAAADSEEP